MTIRGPHFVLPAAGAAALAFGLYQHRCDLAGRSEAARLAGERAALAARAAGLARVPRPSPDEHTDRLPLGLSLGALVQRLERAARDAGIESIEFQTAQPEEHLETSGPPPVEAPGMPTAAPLPSVLRVRPERLECEVRVLASYAAVTRFLGVVEASSPATRVASLQIVPAGQRVQAKVGLRAYYLPDRAPAAPQAAAPPAQGRGR
jgi:hypothetical protein